MNSSLGRIKNIIFIVSYVSHSKVLTSRILKIYSTGRFDDYCGNKNKFSNLVVKMTVFDSEKSKWSCDISN